MNCEKFKKYIVLKPEGLNLTEQNELELHLQTCSSCRKLADSGEKSKIIINKISKNEPELINPGILTNQIMQSVRNLEIQKQALLEGILDKFLNWFFAPFVRPVLVSVAILLISWFMYHESADQLEIASLENRLKKYSVVDYVAVQESQRQFFNINTIQRHKGLRAYILSKYQSGLSSYNQLNSKDEMINTKSNIILLKQLNKVNRKSGLKQFSDSNAVIQ